MANRGFWLGSLLLSSGSFPSLVNSPSLGECDLLRQHKMNTMPLQPFNIFFSFTSAESCWTANNNSMDVHEAQLSEIDAKTETLEPKPRP